MADDTIVTPSEIAQELKKSLSRIVEENDGEREMTREDIRVELAGTLKRRIEAFSKSLVDLRQRELKKSGEGDVEPTVGEQFEVLLGKSEACPVCTKPEKDCGCALAKSFKSPNPVDQTVEAAGKYAAKLKNQKPKDDAKDDKARAKFAAKGHDATIKSEIDLNNANDPKKRVPDDSQKGTKLPGDAKSKVIKAPGSGGMIKSEEGLAKAAGMSGKAPPKPKASNYGAIKGALIKPTPKPEDKKDLNKAGAAAPMAKPPSGKVPGAGAAPTAAVGSPGVGVAPKAPAGAPKPVGTGAPKLPAAGAMGKKELEKALGEPEGRVGRAAAPAPKLPGAGIRGTPNGHVAAGVNGPVAPTKPANVAKPEPIGIFGKLAGNKPVAPKLPAVGTVAKTEPVTDLKNAGFFDRKGVTKTEYEMFKGEKCPICKGEEHSGSCTKSVQGIE